MHAAASQRRGASDSGEKWLARGNFDLQAFIEISTDSVRTHARRTYRTERADEYSMVPMPAHT